ncbi:hypothetical protein OG455_20990 [Kitasatospora sp. NBC_01287]|uniref:hypothetical protein n=1 Tax=Kitasatospora sp. NBC_01287 TaxID=2903573 RepID=UPI0022539232|nr:hypothetical protein [Kitasatospora sp. NBC_01287]MCX4747960.1 hypothetical protein [Kitasatospora sp. NBC_01287]
MSARARRRATAISLTIAVTTGAALLLTACDPSSTSSAAGSAAPSPANSTAPIAASAPTSAAPQSAAPSTAPTAAAPSTATTPSTAAAPSAAPTTAAGSPAAARPASPVPTTAPTTARPQAPAPVAAKLNGTARSGLTISDGTRYVVMNGTTIDFGTAVRDLAWSPDGKKAAFIDGAGDLAVANPNGSGRVTVAEHPAGQSWSHPAWQVSAASPQGYYAAKDNLFFTSTKGGVSQLEGVPATAVHGTPRVLDLGPYSDNNVTPNPMTENLWPAGANANGTTVYANSDSGEVYIRDESLRQQGGAVAKGSEPALSPAGDEIVFVRSVGGHDHLFETSINSPKSTTKDLTPHATTDYTEPTWSADGKTIATRTPAGIATLPANGSATPTLVSGYTGLPAYRNN